MADQEKIVEYEISRGLRQPFILEVPEGSQPRDIALCLVTKRGMMTNSQSEQAEMDGILLAAFLGNTQPFAKQMRIEALLHRPLGRNVCGELFFPNRNQIPQTPALKRAYDMVERFNSLAERLSNLRPNPASPTSS